MSDPTAAQSASSSAAGQPAAPKLRRPSRLNVRHDAHPEGAGDECPAAAVTDGHLGVHAGDKRERSNELATGDVSPASTRSDRHIAVEPHEGVVPPMQPCHPLTTSFSLHSQSVIC